MPEASPTLLSRACLTLYQIEIVNVGAVTTVRAVATARVKVYRGSFDTRVQLKLI